MLCLQMLRLCFDVAFHEAQHLTYSGESALAINLPIMLVQLDHSVASDSHLQDLFLHI